MFGEQQKQEIRTIVSDELAGLKDALETFALPFKSQFRHLVFAGVADGSNMVSNFNIREILGKSILIKSIKVIPYYINASQDISLTDGINTFIETVPQTYRVNRIFDGMFSSSFLQVLLNGSPLPMFTSLPMPIMPLQPTPQINFDMGSEIDNIYYKFPEKLISLDVNYLADVLRNFGPADDTIYARIYIQCYIF